jgi:hypothetical protein
MSPKARNSLIATIVAITLAIAGAFLTDGGDLKAMVCGDAASDIK